MGANDDGYTYLDTTTQELLKWNGTAWEVLLSAGSLPISSIVSLAGNLPVNLANSFLLCDGSEVSRTTYSGLFASIGIRYGGGDGITTFNLPDLRGRTIIGAGQGTGLTNRTLGATGGAETHVLTIGELPAHNHTGIAANAGAHTHNIATNGSYQVQYNGQPTGNAYYNNNGQLFVDGPWLLYAEANGDHTHSLSINNTGSGEAHNNMQPFIVLNYYIKT